MEKDLKKGKKQSEKMIVDNATEKGNSTHNYKTRPIILQLENGTTFHAQSVSVSEINVSDYLK